MVMINGTDIGDRYMRSEIDIAKAGEELGIRIYRDSFNHAFIILNNHLALEHKNGKWYTVAGSWNKIKDIDIMELV